MAKIKDTRTKRQKYLDKKLEKNKLERERMRYELGIPTIYNNAFDDRKVEEKETQFFRDIFLLFGKLKLITKEQREDYLCKHNALPADGLTKFTRGELMKIKEVLEENATR